MVKKKVAVIVGLSKDELVQRMQDAIPNAPETRCNDCDSICVHIVRESRNRVEVIAVCPSCVFEELVIGFDCLTSDGLN